MFFPYVVQPGDTLGSIANRFGTTVAALIQINQIPNPNLIFPGQIIFVPVPVPTIPPTLPPTCPVGSFPYTVRAGDTLFILAQRFGTTLQAILAVNPGIDPNNLRIGQIVCIPQPITCPAGSIAYTIRAGDTLFALAQRFGTTVQAIIALNPGIDPNNLQIGQVICIPQPTTCPTGSFAYTIRAGDTLFILAQRFGTTVQAIIALNPGIDPNNLQIGQVICIPQPISCPVGSVAYTIRAGDTLFALAQRFGTTVQAIIALNPGIDPNNLQIGQVICIPQPISCPVGSVAYTIRAGDTLFALAQRFGTTVQAIIALNPGIDPNNLQIGQVVCIPQPTTCPAGSFAYTIRAGDTLFALAQRFGTTVQAIIALNPGINPNNLQIGQVICIPGTLREGEQESKEQR